MRKQTDTSSRTQTEIRAESSGSLSTHLTTPVMASTTHGGIIVHNSGHDHTIPMGAHGYSTGVRLESENLVTESGMHILGERVEETEITVPKKVYREEIIEKTVVIPERHIREELIEETQLVRERIIQVAKPVLKERIEYFPEIEVVEKIVEVNETRIEWRERPVDKIVFHEVVKNVPKFIEVEKIVEVEQVITQEVPVVRQVEVPEFRTVIKEVPRPVDQYITVDVPVVVEKEEFEEVYRKVPVAVEHVTNQNYDLPQLEAEYEEVPYPVFVPSFTEVPIPADQLTEESRLEAQALAAQIAHVTSQKMPSLCAVEEVGGRGRKFTPQIETNPVELQHRFQAKINQL